MADSTTAATSANKAAEKTAAKVADLAAEKAALKFAEQFGENFTTSALPTVVETAELAMTVPSKIVLNQKLVFVVGVLGGAVLGAGILFGVNKILVARKIRKAVEVMQTTENEKNPKRNA